MSHSLVRALVSQRLSFVIGILSGTSSNRIAAKTRAAALTVAVAGVMVMSPTDARAERVTTTDPVGDVYRYSLTKEGYEVTPSPDDLTADITKTVVAYGDRRLSIKVSVRDIVRSRDVYWPRFRLAGPSSRHDVVVTKQPGGRAHAFVFTRRQGVIECRGLAARVSSAANTIALSVPAACLAPRATGEPPPWIRVGAQTWRVAEDFPFGEPVVSDEPLVAYVDNPHRNGMRNLNQHTLGPKIRRG